MAFNEGYGMFAHATQSSLEILPRDEELKLQYHCRLAFRNSVRSPVSRRACGQNKRFCARADSAGRPSPPNSTPVERTNTGVLALPAPYSGNPRPNSLASDWFRSLAQSLFRRCLSSEQVDPELRVEALDATGIALFAAAENAINDLISGVVIATRNAPRQLPMVLRLVF